MNGYRQLCFPAFFEISCFVFSRRKKLVQVWNNMMTQCSFLPLIKCRKMSFDVETDESFEMYLLHLFENSYFFKLAFHSTHISYQCLCYCTSCRQGFLLMNQTNTHLDWSAVKVKEPPPPQGNHRFWQSSRSHVWCAQVCEVQSGVTPESGHWKCWWTMMSLYSDQIMAVMFTVGLESDTDFHLIAVRLEIYIYSYVCQSQSLNLRCKLHCILSVSTSIFNLVNSFEFYIFYI